jgi:hypothetical protein
VYLIFVGKGRAIAQEVSSRFPITTAWVRAQVRSCEIYGRQRGTGVGFLPVLLFPLPILIPPNSPSSQSPVAGTMARNGRRAEWTQSGLHPPLCELKKVTAIKYKKKMFSFSDLPSVCVSHFFSRKLTIARNFIFLSSHDTGNYKPRLSAANSRRTIMYKRTWFFSLFR